MRDIKKAEELYKTLNGGEWLKDDNELREIMVNYIYGDIFNYGNLDVKLRELILIVVNVTNNTLSALKRHVLEGLHIGVKPIEIKEVLYQCAPYIGVGKVEEALAVVNTILKEEGIEPSLESQSTVNEETRFEEGFQVQCLAFGKENIKAGHDNAPRELKHIQNYLSEYCFGDFYTRKGLDLKKRELITFVVLATLGGCENQLRAHISANIKVGNTREILIETITQSQPYIGFPRTLNAINIINEITNR